MIEVRNLKKVYKIKSADNDSVIKKIFFPKYNYISAVDNINFEVKESEIIGLLGANGAGKSTIIKMLIGVLTPDSGAVFVGGYKPFERNNKFLNFIGVMMGNRSSLFYDLPIIDTYNYLKAIYTVDNKFYNNDIKKLLNEINIVHLLNTPVRKLSLGQRKKAELIAAVLHNPRVLFLDEATIGVDVQSKIEILKFIEYLRINYGTTIIYTSHDLSDVEKLCDRIIYIEKGKKVYDGNIDEFGQVEKYTKVIISFNELIVDIDDFIKRINLKVIFDKNNDYTYEFLCDKDSVMKFLECISNKYDVNELFVQPITLEDKVLNYAGIYN